MGVIFVLAASAARADSSPRKVTFTRDVAPIFMKNCVGCHRPGEIAPMSLLTYAESRPWAKSIKKFVVSREMPPWFAHREFGRWANDPSLTDHEIDTIAKWADQGAPEGDPRLMPPAPQFTVGWQLGEPDYIVDLPEFNIPATGPDLFPNPIIALDLPERRWVRAVEVRPGNKSVNHHVVLFMNGGVTMDSEGGFNILTVWAAGTAPTQYPEGMGRWVGKNDRIISNMHYHPNGVSAETDQTRIGLYFGEGELEQEISAILAGNVTFAVPPGAPNHEVTATHIFGRDSNIISYFPHMHLRGKDMKFTATYPDGTKETLIHVPKWDFDWQLFYYPEEPKFMPKGTEIEIVAHYDNSADNPSNPDPSKTLTFGLESTDEMMFGVFEYIAAGGAQTAPLTAQERLSMLTEKYPAEEVYDVGFQMGSRPMPSKLHLPREGEGIWHVQFGGQTISLPISDIAWNESGFKFTLELNFGGQGGTMIADGAVSDGGHIEATFARPEAPEGETAAPLFVKGFEGTRTQ